MKILANILPNIATLQIAGATDVAISGICIDSRQAHAGTLFVAINGYNADGHDFISAATSKGATVVICERMPSILSDGVTYIKVADSALAAGLIADAYNDHPSRSMHVVGVTGTNGKTTTATLLYQLFTGLGYVCGLISTVENKIGGEVVPATHTTPDAVSIQSLMGRMRDAGCRYVFMEVSSHAIHQQRIAGIAFAGAIFTNITHDHLDYHKTFDEYIRVKKMLFDGLPSSAFALANIDDKRGLIMLQNTKAEKVTYSLQSPANYKGKVIENTLTGLAMQINGTEAHFRMIGTFNAYNLLAVFGAAMQFGCDKLEVLALLSGLQGAPGRFETYLSPVKRILGIVDYAHTPDALINVLATVNQLRTNGQQLITVIGCGGDRDRKKRPLMAEVACTHSDKAILTSDNPRSEDPEQILNDMEAGLSTALRKKAMRITSRSEAIKVACNLAQSGDVILVAGKGHELYQEIKGVKHHFDDREELTKTFHLLNL